MMRTESLTRAFPYFTMPPKWNQGNRVVAALSARTRPKLYLLQRLRCRSEQLVFQVPYLYIKSGWMIAGSSSTCHGSMNSNGGCLDEYPYKPVVKDTLFVYTAVKM